MVAGTWIFQAFGTEYKSAYLPTSPEGSMSSCNPSDSITSLSDGNHDDIFNRADNSMNTHTFVIPPPPPPPALSMTCKSQAKSLKLLK